MMRAIFICLLASLLGSFAIAQVPMTGAGLPKPGAAGGGYVGPGDSSVVGPAIAWWATFSCYNAAYSGPIMDVVDTATFATTGSRVNCAGGTAAAITSSSACSWLTSGGPACSPLATTCATSCSVHELYDQAGNSSCSGNPCHLLGSNLTEPALLALNALNSSFHCLSSNSAASLLVAANSLTQIQPFTLLMTSKRISGTADLYGALRDASSSVGTIRLGYTVSANAASMYNGNSFTSVTASDTHFHALGGVFANATQSVLYVDGTGTNVNLGGSTGFAAAPAILTAGANTTSVVVCEGGIWNGDIGATKNGNYSTNVVARYGVLP